MRTTRHTRQIFLFLVAILVPAGVLIGLAVQVINQDRELASKHALDQRREAADQVQRELASRLETIKLQEINRLIRSPGGDSAHSSGNPAAIFTARLEGDRLVFPWDVPAEPSKQGSKEFAARRQAGEAQEFVQKDYGAAALAYRAALAAALQPEDRSEARLLLARTLAKAGNKEEASREYAAILTDSGEARDELGIGYRFYGAAGQLSLKREPEAVLRFLNTEANGSGDLAPAEVYMLRTQIASFPQTQTAPLRQQIAKRVGEIEQIEAFSKDFPRVKAQVEAGSASSSVWVPYGRELWLVTVTRPQPPLPALAISVSAAKVVPPGVKLLSRSANGDALGEAFPGLRVEWSDNRFAKNGSGSLPIALWMAALTLVLGVAAFGGYLLLRDVNRDVRMNEVRSQFVASVSHELKTPLTAIRMFAETVAMGRTRDPQTNSEYLETIVSECERLARLVDNVLDFSKIEQGKKIYRFRPTRLEQVADSAARAMQFPLAQQGFRLRVSVEGEMPELQADSDAMEQAILNLLTNAMKYSGDAREIEMRLSARNGAAVIAVADHGLGISPEEQQRIFEKFYRAPSHESRLIAGTGLGLTLVAHIASAHGGRVEVESVLGSGSTFSILIPAGANA